MTQIIKSFSTKQNPCKLESCEQMSIVKEREHKKGITLHCPTPLNLYSSTKLKRSNSDQDHCSSKFLSFHHYIIDHDE